MEFSEDTRKLMEIALREDIGAGDVTTRACVNPSIRGEANIIAKASGVICGQHVARAIFKAVDSDTVYAPLCEDGDLLEPGRQIAEIAGRFASILTAERTALNFLMRLSGVASITREFVSRVSHTSCSILDTRKTTPGFRELEKYAVRCGGGTNHRSGLYDMILIKDNHIRSSGSLTAALNRCKSYVESVTDMIPIEVEVSSMPELEQALDGGADWIMLDNMDISEINTAVRLIREQNRGIKVEVSGGVSLETVAALAECGVDYISAGALTHSARALDLSLNVVRITG